MLTRFFENNFFHNDGIRIRLKIRLSFTILYSLYNIIYIGNKKWFQVVALENFSIESEEIGRNVAFIEPVDEVLVVQPPKPNTATSQNDSNSPARTVTAMEIDTTQVINSPRAGIKIATQIKIVFKNQIKAPKTFLDKSKTTSKTISIELTTIRKRSLWPPYWKPGFPYVLFRTTFWII